MIGFIRVNLYSFIMVFFSVIASVLIGNFIESFKFLVTLAFGAKILAFLLWGPACLFGILLAKAFQYFFFTSFDVSPDIAFTLSLVAISGPLISMYLMKISNVSSIFQLKDIDFRHVVFFIVISSMFSSLFKYTYMMQDFDLSYHAAEALLSSLIGQLFGGLFFVYTAIKFSPQIYVLLKKFDQAR